MPAITLEQLPEDCFVTIKNYTDSISFEYTTQNGKLYITKEQKMLGSLTISIDNTNITKKIYNVDFAKAQSGYGPLLYRIAMEFVNKITNGKGYLKSDPIGVSSDAERVWNYFDYKAKDVDKKQLDSLQNELTPTKIDNVDQSFVRGEYKRDWYKSPLSRGFVIRKDDLLNHPKVILNIKENKIIKIRIQNVKK